MIVTLDFKEFETKLNNVVDYSMGFIEGVQSGKRVFLRNLGVGVIEGLSLYIDGNARMNPLALSHMYEWYANGSPEARLFDLQYEVRGSGLSINSTFRQSSSLENGSTEPFYNKAKIMEEGIPVTITPKGTSPLVFEVDGETIFTRKPVHVDHPGGPAAQGAYTKIFDMFFSQYFTQSFLRASGILDYLENPITFKKNLKTGSMYGKSEGIKTGYNWITNAKIGL